MARAAHSESFQRRLSTLPLRYRLSIPFFLLAFLGTFSLVGLGILSQNTIISKEENDRLFSIYRALHHNLEVQGRWAVSLASSFARNPEINEALAAKDRMRLITMCYPWFLFMRQHYGIAQFNFHTLPPRNFLRFQRLYEFGDDLGYRKTIADAVARQGETFGLEKGLTGYGIRGVAPVFFQGEMVGVVEIGFNFGTVFLDEMKQQFNIEASFLIPDSSQSAFASLATTFADGAARTDPEYAQAFQLKQPEILLKEILGIPFAILLGTVPDYQGETAVLVELCMRRTETLLLAAHYRHLMVGLGIFGMILSVWAIYVISKYFAKPIGQMIGFAKAIAAEEEVVPLDVYPQGELGVLADALDNMLAALQQSREKERLYTVNLEDMVQARTQALRESEEKYRTLVENVPLVVYRLLQDGRTIYINQFIEDLAGISPSEALSAPGFWKNKVWHEDRPRVWPLMDRCLQEGMELKAEYRILHPNGEFLHILDHALPVYDDTGRLYSVDGFLVNVTERHQLQEQIIQTEELRTLSEISARLAHEIRNPLVVAGGFSRRIVQSLPESDSTREKAQIIVQQVARLEKILEQMLVYLKPFEIVPAVCSLNNLILQVLDDQRDLFTGLAVHLDLHLSAKLPAISLDHDLIKRALVNIVIALLELCQPEQTLEVRTYLGEHNAHLELSLRGVRLSEDDLEHFFYPFATSVDRPQMLDLPMAKMIIHKHQGLVELKRKDRDIVMLSITLPLG